MGTHFPNSSSKAWKQSLLLTFTPENKIWTWIRKIKSLIDTHCQCKLILHWQPIRMIQSSILY
jgi:hypothetical protein